MFSSGSEENPIVDEDRIDKLSDCLKAGYLIKRGQKYKSFKKRFFVLMSDGYIFYFKDNNDLDHPLGIISLKANAFLNKAASEISDSLGFGFTIRSGSKRFLLAAETNDEKNTWLRLIDRTISNCTSKEKLGQQNRKRSVAFTNGNNNNSNGGSTSPLSTSNGSGSNLNVNNNEGFSPLERDKLERLQKLKDDALRQLEQIDPTFVRCISLLNEFKKDFENKKEENENKIQESEKTKLSSSVERNGNDDLTDSDYESSDDEKEKKKTSYDTTLIIAPSTVSDLMNPVERLKGLKITLDKFLIDFENVKEKFTDYKNKEKEDLKKIDEEKQEYEQELESLRKKVKELEEQNEELNSHKKLLIREVKKLRETSPKQQ
ncbi:hypothetical protein ABK040_009142 [Willaertia magna]